MLFSRFELKGCDPSRQYLVTYIADSAAGFSVLNMKAMHRHIYIYIYIHTYIYIYIYIFIFTHPYNIYLYKMNIFGFCLSQNRWVQRNWLGLSGRSNWDAPGKM